MGRNKRRRVNKPSSAKLPNEIAASAAAAAAAASKQDHENEEENMQLLKELKEHLRSIQQPKHAVMTDEISYDDKVIATLGKPPKITVQSSLADLIYPLKVSDFLDDYFQPLQKESAMSTTTPQFRRGQVAFHVTCHAGHESRHAERIRGLVDNEMLGLDPKRLLEETSSESIFVWLRPSATAADTGEGQEQQQQRRLVQSIEVSDASNALALLQCGHATYCRAPPSVEQPLVANLLRSTGLGCGHYDPTGNSTRCMGRGEVEIFMTSNTGSQSSLHATDWHFDFQENFTIQLSGKKQWTLQSGTTPFPLRGCTPHYASPASVEGQLQAAHLVDRKFQFGHPQVDVNAMGEPQTVMMIPGDVLYFPAGMWHKVECIEPGVSINISLMATSYANVVCQAIQHLLLQRDEWRRPVIRQPEHRSGIPFHMERLLLDLPDIIRSYEVKNDLTHCILPPILQHPPGFDPSEGSYEDLIRRLPKADDDDESEEEGAGDHDDDDEVDDGENGEKIVSVMEFRAPEKWKAKNQGKTNWRLIKNPLARLTRMDEITGFYKKFDQPQSGDECNNTANLFVLHINYAGNEMLESAVRVVLRDDPTSKCLSRVYDTFEQVDADQQSDQVTCLDPAIIANHETMTECMLFYGYLQWKYPLEY